MAAPHVVEVGDPDWDNPAECPECGFDALFTFPFYRLTVDGVTRRGEVQACGRCRLEKQADRA